jgi:hypothetical protein
MISKIDSSKIRYSEENFNHIIEKYNLLVELYAMSVNAQLMHEELYEVNFNNSHELQRNNIGIALQLKKQLDFDKIIVEENTSK